MGFMKRISQKRHTANEKRLEQLKAEGYSINVSANGYQVWFGEKYVKGATIMAVRYGPLTNDQFITRIRHFTEQAILAVDQKDFPFNVDKSVAINTIKT